jgi:hypothetical protein
LLVSLLLLTFLVYQWCCGISAVRFEHVVAGVPAVTGFPAVDGVVVATAPAYPGVPTLAGGLTYLIVE